MHPGHLAFSSFGVNDLNLNLSQKRKRCHLCFFHDVYLEELRCILYDMVVGK